MVKTLDAHIKKAFVDLGFTDDEVKNGCWLLERNEKAIAWICLHKFLERVAQKAGITFDEPKVFNLEKDEIALYVNGRKDGFTAWAIGEASAKNCKNDYRWAMAEKRAKDRVILKLLGVAGDVYSEEEADDFKQKPEKDEFEKQAAAEKAARTKALKAGKDIPASKQSLEERYQNAMSYIYENKNRPFTPSVIDRINSVIDDLYAANRIKEATDLSAMMKEHMDIQDDADFLDQVIDGTAEFKTYAL